MVKQTDLGQPDFAPIWTDVSTCGSCTRAPPHAAFIAAASSCGRFHPHEWYPCLGCLTPRCGAIWKLHSPCAPIDRTPFKLLSSLDVSDTEARAGFKRFSTCYPCGYHREQGRIQLCIINPRALPALLSQFPNVLRI